MAKGNKNKHNGGYQPFPHQRAAGATGYVKTAPYRKKGGGESSTMAAPQPPQRPRRRASTVAPVEPRPPPREAPELVTARIRPTPRTGAHVMRGDREVPDNPSCTSLMPMHVPHTCTGEGIAIARRFTLMAT